MNKHQLEFFALICGLGSISLSGLSFLLDAPGIGFFLFLFSFGCGLTYFDTKQKLEGI